MKKDDIIRENQHLKSDNEVLNSKIAKYKKAIESLRDFYGEKLIELENKRLMKLHPDVFVADIEWYPADIDRFLNSEIHRYYFRYEIKGELNSYEVRKF